MKKSINWLCLKLFNRVAFPSKYKQPQQTISFRENGVFMKTILE